MNPVTVARRLVLALLVVSAVFAAAPDIDLGIASAFFRDGRWVFEAWPGMVVFNKGFNTATHWFSGVLALVVAALALQRWRQPLASTAALRKTGYLLLVIALGPGLLVNAVLKEQWGRARPSQVAEFGGSAAYTPVWLPSDGLQSAIAALSRGMWPLPASRSQGRGWPPSAAASACGSSAVSPPVR